MGHKLDRTEKAWDIFIAQAITKNQVDLHLNVKSILIECGQCGRNIDQLLIDSGLYEGMSWSADRKWPKIDVDTKEKFMHNLLTKHAISHSFTINLENI